MDRAGSVVDCHPHIVYANDLFGCDLGENVIHHTPYFLCGHDEPGNMIAVYAVAHLHGGGKQIELMPAREVLQHRERSQAKNSGPWVTDEAAMWLKTVIRKIAKYLPSSSEILQRALDLDDKADRGVEQDFDMANIVIDVPGAQATGRAANKGLSALKERLVQAVEVEDPKPAAPAPEPAAEPGGAPPAPEEQAGAAEAASALPAAEGIAWDAVPATQAETPPAIETQGPAATAHAALFDESEFPDGPVPNPKPIETKGRKGGVW
jgi:recombination protein RecT